MIIDNNREATAGFAFSRSMYYAKMLEAMINVSIEFHEQLVNTTYENLYGEHATTYAYINSYNSLYESVRQAFTTTLAFKLNQLNISDNLALQYLSKLNSYITETEYEELANTLKDSISSTLNKYIESLGLYLELPENYVISELSDEKIYIDQGTEYIKIDNELVELAKIPESEYEKLIDHYNKVFNLYNDLSTIYDNRLNIDTEFVNVYNLTGYSFVLGNDQDTIKYICHSDNDDSFELDNKVQTVLTGIDCQDKHIIDRQRTLRNVTYLLTKDLTDNSSIIKEVNVTNRNILPDSLQFEKQNETKDISYNAFSNSYISNIDTEHQQFIDVSGSIISYNNLLYDFIRPTENGFIIKINDTEIEQSLNKYSNDLDSMPYGGLNVIDISLNNEIDYDSTWFTVNTDKPISLYSEKTVTCECLTGPNNHYTLTVTIPNHINLFKLEDIEYTLTNDSMKINKLIGKSLDNENAELNVDFTIPINRQQHGKLISSINKSNYQLTISYTEGPSDIVDIITIHDTVKHEQFDINEIQETVHSFYIDNDTDFASLVTLSDSATNELPEDPIDHISDVYQDIQVDYDNEFSTYTSNVYVQTTFGKLLKYKFARKLINMKRLPFKQTLTKTDEIYTETLSLGNASLSREIKPNYYNRINIDIDFKNNDETNIFETDYDIKFNDKQLDTISTNVSYNPRKLTNIFSINDIYGTHIAALYNFDLNDFNDTVYNNLTPLLDEYGNVQRDSQTNEIIWTTESNALTIDQMTYSMVESGKYQFKRIENDNLIDDEYDFDVDLVHFYSDYVALISNNDYDIELHGNNLNEKILIDTIDYTETDTNVQKHETAYKVFDGSIHHLKDFSDKITEDIDNSYRSIQKNIDVPVEYKSETEQLVITNTTNAGQETIYADVDSTSDSLKLFSYKTTVFETLTNESLRMSTGLPTIELTKDMPNYYVSTLLPRNSNFTLSMLNTSNKTIRILVSLINAKFMTNDIPMNFFVLDKDNKELQQLGEISVDEFEDNAVITVLTLDY